MVSPSAILTTRPFQCFCLCQGNTQGIAAKIPKSEEQKCLPKFTTTWVRCTQNLRSSPPQSLTRLQKTLVIHLVK